jgi:hypothetical protein
MARSDPGGALVSAAVRQAIRDPIVERLVSRGIVQLDKMSETTEAFALSGARTASISVPRPATPRTEPSLAVLPFQNLGGDPEFAQELADNQVVNPILEARGLAGRTDSDLGAAARCLASPIGCRANGSELN